MFQFHDKTKLQRAVGMLMACAGLMALMAGPAVAGPPTIRLRRPGQPIARPVPVSADRQLSPGVPAKGPQPERGQPDRSRDSGRGDDIGPGTPGPMLSANLKIEQGSGDFSQWVTSTTVNETGRKLMRWTNTRPNVNVVQWQVSDAPLPWNNPDMNQPGIIKTGYIAPIAQGKSVIFPIEFDKILPQSPPSKPKDYYIRIVTLNTPQNKLMVSTKPVTITYQKSGNWGQKFTAEGLGQTVKQKQAWMYLKSPMPIEIDLKELYIGNDNEDDDDPYLFVFVMYVDGTTINPLNFASSTVRIDSPSKTHENVSQVDKYSGEDLEEGDTANIPGSTGHFEKTIVPIGYGLADDLEDADGSIGQAMRDYTSVYIVVVAMEEDNTSTSAANAARAAMLSKLQSGANGIVQQLTLPGLLNGGSTDFDLATLQREMKEKAFDAAKDATLTSGWWTPLFAPVVLAQISDPDDCVGYAYKEITLGQLLDSGPGGISLDFNLANSSDWEGAYTVRGSIRRKN